MAEEDEAQSAPDVQVFWDRAPTFFSDGPLGDAWARGVHRITFGEFALDPKRGATSPGVRPVCTMIMTPEAVAATIEYLQNLANKNA
jgi:hypothetical protein